MWLLCYLSICAGPSFPNFVDCSMKQTRLLLLILVLTVQQVQAQHVISVTNRKLSPVLQNNRKLLTNKQAQVFWIVTSNTDSARKYFNDKKIPLTILQEHAGGLLV